MKKGIGVSKGYAVGKAYVVNTDRLLVFNESSQDPATEADRLQKALELSSKQIEAIVEKAHEKLDAKNVEIIESHLNFLKDPAFTGEAFSKIKQESISAEKTISDVTQTLYDTFSEFDDDYMKERAADIKDVGSRILRNLLGQSGEVDFAHLPTETVLFAHDLKPSDTAQIDKEKVCAFVTETGGETSHTAILAKALGIPAVVGCKDILACVQSGDAVIVNGLSGEVIVNPDANMIEQYQFLERQFNQKIEDYRCAAKTRIYAKDGRQIITAANIGGLKDIETALKNGAEGVGLFRTEFLYMNRSSIPTEEEQFQVYKEAAERLDGKPLTIRTLDIGGDKSLPYLPMEKENNPFLGLRAIRMCLKNPDIFKTQLRAILRASVYGNIQIMFPMISCIEELNQAKVILNTCKSQLKRESIHFDSSVKTGMMIEIPSAALIAEEFAKQVDFFSIGTNDLTQYTLAVDRMNESISALYNPLHPAVLRLIQMTISAAHASKIPCCMCGELASNEQAIPLLLKYGLDEFSVSPGIIAETKNILLQNVCS
nr:phosphoenolpyruvate--protein phosphotransferase [uncultured Caproiciproducens sp.]